MLSLYTYDNWAGELGSTKTARQTAATT
jgi:hypothetical protein